jgi:hypothetical protein
MILRRRTRVAILGVAALVALACSGRDAPTPAPRFGELMTAVGRRFELLGRAGVARRWELAAFELGELREAFEDVPAAIVPADAKVDVRQLAKGFVPGMESALAGAIATRDETALVAAFSTAAQACNACHRASGKAFIEVPSHPGDGVPVLEPLP